MTDAVARQLAENVSLKEFEPRRSARVEEAARRYAEVEARYANAGGDPQ